MKSKILACIFFLFQGSPALADIQWELLGHWVRDFDLVKEERFFYADGTARELLTINGELGFDLSTKVEIDNSMSPSRIHSTLTHINYLDPRLDVKIPEGEQSFCLFAAQAAQLRWECGRGKYPDDFSGEEGIYKRVSSNSLKN